MKDIRHLLKDLFYHILDELILFVLLMVITYFSSFLINLRVQTVFAIVTGSLILVVAVMIVKRKKRISYLIWPIRPQSGVDLERLGLSQYAEPDPLLLDNTHKISFIEQTYVVDGQDGYYILRYKGTNETDQPSRFFRDGVVGDSPMDVSLMNIQVSDRVRGTPLKWRLLKDSPYEKIIEIYLFQPLKKGEEFDIEVSCKWLGTFTRHDDYVFYPIHYYKRGVQRLIAKLILSNSPKYIEGIAIENGKPVLAPSQPYSKKENNKFVVTWEMSSPTRIYLVHFGRQDIS